MVAQVRCKAIAEENYKSFLQDETWLETKKQVADSPEVVEHFGEKVSSICESCLSDYDRDAHYFHHTQRDEYKERLTEDLMKDIQPTYRILVDHMFQATLKEFLDAVQENIEKDIALDNMKTEHFITELRNKFEDAAVNGADPEYATNRIALLKSTMDTVIAKAALVVNQLVMKEMVKEKKNMWKKFAIVFAVTFATMSVAAVGGAAGAAAPALAHALAPALAQAAAVAHRHPTLGSAIARSVAPAVVSTLGHATSAVIKALLEENPEAAQSLADLMASVVKEASEVLNIDCCPSSSAA